MADEILSTVELAAALEVTPQRVASWVRKGMPIESRNGNCKFRAGSVERWLLKQGLIAKREAPRQTEGILRNRAEVAKHFGVNEHTISYWHRRPGFPGRPGTPGANGTDGYYPIAEIEEWRRGMQGRHGPTGSGAGVDVERARLLGIQCQERELRLKQRQKQLVEVAEVEAFMRRTVAQAGSLIDELPDRIMACLPADLGDSSRRAIRLDVAGVVRDVRSLIGELVVGDADEQVGA